VVQSTCQAVYKAARANLECPNMGASLSLLLILDTTAYLAHVGDSKIFLLRQEQVHKLTHDHTFVNEMVERGEMSLEDAINSPFGHVLTRWMGQAEVLQVEMLSFDILPGDRFLICSDGLASIYENNHELTSLLSHKNGESIAAELVTMACERDGSDNCTAIFKPSLIHF